MVTWQGQQYPDWKAARAAMVAPAESAVAVMEMEPPPVEAQIDHIADAGKMVLTAQDDRPAKRQSLVAKHRPRTLGDVVGQAEAVAQLKAIAAEPIPCALILAGATGTGKTSAAWALAADLGCDIDANPAEFGGVYSIASGEHNAAGLREVWPMLWQTPMLSRHGWKVLLINEVEQLTGAVEALWLDRLENLPPKTIVVFTTNAAESLPDRFIDRCTLIEFEGDGGKLAGAARNLAASVWRAETGGEIPADAMSKVMDRATVAGRLSFRRVVQALVPLIAARRE